MTDVLSVATIHRAGCFERSYDSCRAARDCQQAGGEMNTQAQKQMKNALTGLMLEGQEFFASLALRLPLVQDESISTACTNGQCIRYNPGWVLKLSRDAQKALLCHEVMHVACGHMWRIDLRDPAKSNIAMDLAINPIIAASPGLTLPPGALVDSAYAGMSFEQIYRLLPDQPGGGGGNGQPGGGGQDVQPAPGDSHPDTQGNGMSEQDWKQAIVQAAKQAQAQGVMPAGFERLLNQIKFPACRDLVAALLEFCSRTAREDYSFRRASKPAIARGLVLPSLYSVSCPPIVACVDTSGSVYDELLEDYRGALQSVLDECKPETLAVISCDSAIHSVAEYAEGDQIAGKFPGGGGTSFVPALARAAEYDPAAALYLTDTYGTFPDEPPAFPVLWCVFDSAGERTHVPPHMGETLFLE